jgi:hypothetical protein
MYRARAVEFFALHHFYFYPAGAEEPMILFFVTGFGNLVFLVWFDAYIQVC